MSTEDGHGRKMTVIPQQNLYVKSLDGEEISTGKGSPDRTRPRFRDVLRAFRLQCVSLIFGRFTKWNSKTEYRKVAMHRSRRMAVWHSLLHLLPLSGGIVLLILQWSKYWIGTETNASLVEVLLCIIRAEAVNGYVPLGALSGATQPTQLSYLWSLDFISIATSPAIRGWRKTAFLLIIPILLILTSLVGPSSAILMIPRSDIPHIVGEVDLYATNSMKDLYPEYMGGLNLNGLDIAFEEYNLTLGGQKTDEANLTDETDHEFRYRFESIVSNSRGLCGSSSRTCRSSVEPWSDYHFSIATLPTCFDALHMKSPNDYKYGNIEARSISATTTYPVVTTRCQFSDYLLSDSRNHFDTGDSAEVLYLHDDGTSLGILFDLRTLVDRVSNFSGSSSATSPTFGDVYFPPVWTASPEPGSKSLVSVLSYWSSLNSTEEPPSSLSHAMTQTNSETGRLHIIVCTISAYWVSGKIQMTFEKSGKSDVRTGTLPMSIFENAKQITLGVDEVYTIHSPEFLRDLIKLEMKATQTMYVSNTLSTLLAIAISAKPSYTTIVQDPLPPHYDEREVSAFRYTTIVNGYGYGNKPISVQLAMAVMITYCVITVAYLAYIIVSKSTSTAWNSAIEFIMLALQSRKPDHLGNFGVGINFIKTFQEGVGIRVNRDNELELVFAHDRNVDKRGLRKIERNREY